MAADPDNVRVAVTGVVSVAPPATALPTDSTTALNIAFTDVGEIGEDGVQEAWSDDTAEIKNNAGVTVRRLITGTSATFEFTMLEENSTTLGLYYKGSAVAGSGPYSIAIGRPQTDHREFVIDVLDGDLHKRIVIPDGEVSERQAVDHVSSTATAYRVTLSCYPDDAGNLMYKYSDSTAWA